MSILVVTTLGNFVIDLYHDESPKECLNFLKLCEKNFYQLQFFYNLNKEFVVQSGNPQYQTNSLVKETSVWGLKEGKSLLVRTNGNSIRHDRKGLVSFVSSSSDSMLIGSQFMITLTDEQKVLSDLDKKGVVFGKITEGLDIIDKINHTVVDDNKRPLEDIIILHTYVLLDPFPQEKFDEAKLNSTKLEISSLRYFLDHDADTQISELSSKLLTLEMIGDIDSNIKPSEKVLFICKLNPITKETDLQIIFQRFGEISNIEIIKDKLTGKSLNYGFIEFTTKEACESLYLKMDNVLIDDRRIHVDFSQSIAKERKHHLNHSERNRHGEDKRRHHDSHSRRDRYGRDSYNNHSRRDGHEERRHHPRESERRSDSSRSQRSHRDHYRDREDDYRSKRHRDDRYHYSEKHYRNR